MKLVFLVDKFPPLVDGVGDYTFHLFSEFSANGFRSYVICRENDEIKKKFKGVDNVFPIVRSWTKRDFAAIFTMISDLQPDVVLFQYVPYSFNKKGMPLHLPYLLKEIKRRSGAKILIRFHEVFIRLRYWPFHYLLVGLAQRFIVKKLCSIADFIVTSIDYYSAMLGRYTKKRVFLVPIGSSILPSALTSEQLRQYRKGLVKANHKVVVTFGIRDHRLLVEVFKQVLEKFSRVKLVVCGKIMEHNVYNDIIDQTIVTGYLQPEDVFKTIRSSDVFFLPDELKKRTEGGTSNKSTALAAGIAAGIPIVGIRGDMNNVLLQNVRQLFLEDANRPDMIADRIILLLERTPEPDFFFWDEYLSWRKIARAYPIHPEFAELEDRR